MMTPAKKADYLINDVYNLTSFPILNSLKCVDEILNVLTNEDGSIPDIEKHGYWVTVKKELFSKLTQPIPS